MRRAVLTAALLLASCGTPAPPADAFVEPGAHIVSASLARLEQGDDNTNQVAVSGDGRYAVFQTRARNFFSDDDPDQPGMFRAGGIFRRDLVTGALELVASGDLRPEASPDTVLRRGALNPSVNGDGRFVAFSTGWQLAPQDTNGNVDVYVRDMTKPIGDPAAFELVSARDGGDLPATYAPMPEGQDRRGVNPGSEITGRGGISGDGRHVVFRTSTVASDLPDALGPSTPEQQVFVRDRVGDRTLLITRERLAGEPAGGALGAAVISADGTTVAWVGRNAPAQTPFLAGEGENPSLEYYLWRRFADGPATVTRRITGIADLDDPACAPRSAIVDDPTASGPCYGPLGQAEGYVGGIVNQAPALSADGRRVAFISSATPRAQAQTGFAGDLTLADMGPGVSRKSGSVELTREGIGDATVSSPLEGVAMSADGRWALVTTFRTTFVLPALRVIGVQRPSANARELHLIDLRDRTIDRVLRGFDAADIDGSVGTAPAISADGRRIVFTSSATNLFFGDANGRVDAFDVERLDTPPAEPPVPEPVDAAPEAAPLIEPDATRSVGRLRVTVRRSVRGVLKLVVRAPGAGAIIVVARGRLPDAKGRPAGRAMTLGRASSRAKRATRVSVTLRIARTLRRRLRAAGRIRGQAEVRLRGTSGIEYRGTVTVEFRR